MATVKILLIDDSAALLKYMASLLTKDGHAVIQATSLPQALAAGDYQAILSDFVLGGGLTGIAAIEALFEKKKTPAAILTHGPLDPEDEKRAKELGVHILKKPVRGKEDEFSQNVGFWLKESKLIS